MPALMKGHRWRDHKRKMTYPAWVEVKYDEIRCEVRVAGESVQFLSYAGKPLANMERFAPAFVELSKATGSTHFDCGFEANGSFNDSYRWVRSTRGLPADLEGVATRFILFDLPEYGALQFADRSLLRHNVSIAALSVDEFGDTALVLPYGEWARSEADVDTMFEQARKHGFEGLMVKSMQHLYEGGKRSYGWLKVKPEDDADGVITAINQAVAEDGSLHEWAGSVDIKCEDGSIASPHGIPHELGADMVAHPEKYLGQWAEFNYMERDRQGGYRHPTWGRLREAKA